jgi:drug/metabolite transporter (DMT)-like permease
MSYNYSLKQEKVNLFSLVRSTLRVLFGFIFQVIFFDVIPDAWTITGAMIVTISVLLISLKKIKD